MSFNLIPQTEILIPQRIMENSFLTKGNLVFLPFDYSHAELIFRWQFDKRYQEFFRNLNFLTREECQQYPQRVGAMVFMIYHNEACVGLIQAIPQTNKNNKSFFAGILLEEEAQKKNLGVQAYILLFSILFNKFAFEKAIVEVLAHRKEIITRLSKYGFLFEGLLKDEVFFNGKMCDEVRYSMSRNYYNKHHNKG